MTTDAVRNDPAAPTNDPWASYATAGPADFTGWPGFDRLLFLTYGVRLTAVLYASTELNLADLLAGGPRTAEDLAAATGTNARSLARMLRTAASVGLFAEQRDGRWAITEVSEKLRTDLPDSLRNLILLAGHPMMWRSYGELLTSLRTGKPAFEHVFGKPFYEYLGTHEDYAKVFDESMVQRSQLVAERIVRQAELGRFGRIVDVAGGRGSLLVEILRQYPDVRGVLFERDVTLVEARRYLAEVGLSDRVEFQAGDFFAGVTPGADAYMLKAVLHNWEDDEAVAILRRVREALGGNRDGRVFIIEKVLAGPNEWDYSKLIDTDMMVLMGGGERDFAEWKRLVEEAGLTVVAYPGTGRSPWTFIECGLA
jgi:O-methyltransferase domain/Dimerisation domain